jgi:transcriptional regulator
VNLLQGTVDVMILKTLSRDPLHGFGISRSIRERSGGVLGLEDAALYQALHRLEAKGCLESQWGLSENNRRAKFYQLTPEGQRQLKRETAAWKKYALAVFEVLELAR